MGDNTIMFIADKPSGVPCDICKGEVIEFSISNDVWNMIMRPDGKEGDNEYICIQCFTKRWFEMLKYSIEQLIHFTCPCGYHWTHSGPLPDWIIVCPKCNAVAYELEQVTDRPLIEAFSDKELANELSKRKGIDFTQISSGLALKAIEEHLAKGGTIEIPSLGIKTNAISLDAGMPQRGVK